MTLITRLSRLFQADIHAVLDKIEEPELLLKQAIRDMEAAITQDERHIRLWEYEQQQLKTKYDQLAEVMTEMDEKLALCFQANKDDLAKPLLKRKLETQLTLKSYSAKIATLKENIANLTKELTEHRTQLASMKQKAEILMDANKPDCQNWEHSTATVKDEDVEVAFLAEKQKWGQA